MMRSTISTLSGLALIAVSWGSLPVYKAEANTKEVWVCDTHKSETTNSQINLRQRPGYNTKVLGTVKTGTEIDQLIELKDIWYKARFSGAVEGVYWIHAEYVCYSNLDALPHY